VPFVAGEIRAALDEKLAVWNKAQRRRFGTILLEKIGAGESASGTEFVRLGDAWTVEIYPDLDGKLQPGEIEIYSELGAPQKADYGAGSLTRRIFPQKAEAAPESSPTVATAAPPAASEAEEEDRTKGIVLAYLRYAEADGQRTFEVTKNQVVIGRGGRSYWVDLKLETLPDVSREHCRIRRDPETGRFTIEDVSQFGTAVDGKPVGQNASAELPKHATISLAGVIDLRWEAV
jgi:hypothetical protein